LDVDKSKQFTVSKRKLKSGEIMFWKIKKILVLAAILSAMIISAAADAPAAEKKHTVVIDAAHGGQDAGVKITDKIGEKDITLAIALELRKELAKDENLTVFFTRDTDKEVSLEDRQKEITKVKPDILLSLHINAGFGKNAAGFEIYYPGFKKVTDQRKPSKGSSRDVQNKYLNDSVKLAQIMQKSLDTLFPRKGRGLREAETPILEGMDVAAVVVEIGFASNPEERKKLLSAAGQSEIARTLVKGIKIFFR